MKLRVTARCHPSQLRYILITVATRQEPSIDHLIMQLGDRLQSGECVLFAGSGLSAQVGFPTWKMFAQMLVDRFGFDGDQATDEGALDIDDADSIVYNISRDHPTELVNYVREIFGARPQLSETHRLLSELDFRAAITSNWDHLLESMYPRASVFLPEAAEQIHSNQLKRQFFLLKAYGDPEKPESLILSAPEFDRQVAANAPFIPLMQSILLQQTVVFIGCSLDGIDNFLRTLRFFQPTGQHFALTGIERPSWRAKARLLADKYHVSIIPYQEPGGLLDLVKRLAAQSSPTGRVESNQTVQTLRSHSGAVRSVAITPDGRSAISGSFDSTLKFWDLASGQLLRTLVGHSGAIYSMVLTSDGRRAITSSDDRTLRVWDLSSGRCLLTIANQSGSMVPLAISPDDQYVISGSSTHSLNLWDLSTGQLVREFKDDAPSAIWAIAFTPDGKTVIAGSDARVKVWAFASGQLLRSIEFHSGSAVSLATTSDGQYLIAGFSDGTLKILNLMTGEVRRSWNGHSGPIWSVKVMPGEQRLVSGASDGTLKIWYLESGQALRTLAGHKEGIGAVAVTPDGRRIVSASADETLKIWFLSRARLCRATFMNIGPFEHLDINFDAGLTIFLGNNGAGKSSILKALAIAACGSDSAPWADRLIRAGQSSATITVHTSDEVYRTHIRRKLGGSGAEVESLPIRLLEGEGWLILGFPPLRSGSWNSPAATNDGTPIPTSDDVLPLVRGGADPRLDRLKEWVVNLDYRIKDSKESAAGESLERLIRDFFDIVGHLTEGCPVRFGGVDSSSREVTVITEDGRIPIEQVSQGMVSLISWVGVLLQRLSEVYGGQQSNQHHALVLMDEIDAHMHPSWQQILIPRLKSIFPNVQFIATTHSPLIVAGRSREEILVFERDGETKKISVSRPSMDFTGLRTDQILTSPAFGLSGARDSETVQKQRRYGDLLNKEVLTPAEEEEIAALRADPAVSARIVEETPHIQEVADLVLSAIEFQLKDMSVEKQRQVAADAEDRLKQMLRDFPV